MNTIQLKNRGLAWRLAVLTAALVAVVCAGSAGAVPQIMAPYGDQMAWFGSEINAMGSTGTALYRGGYSSVFNPALLAEATGYRVDGAVSLDQEHEDRFQPLFDSFESYVTDTAISSTRHHYFQTGFAVAGRPGMGSIPVSVGLSLTDRYDFGYNFTEELRNPSPYAPNLDLGEPARDQIIENRKREVTGTLRNLSLGVGYQAHERIKVGAAAHYAFGTRTEITSVRDNVTPENSYDNRDQFDMNGVNFTVGVQGTVNERVEIGLAWESELSAEGDWSNEDYDGATGETVSGTTDAYYRYPQAFRAGLAFRPRTEPRTVFTMELEYRPWSDFQDFRNEGQVDPPLLEDTMDVRVGLEHTFYNGMPLRFGFRHFDSYADKESQASVFSAGLGAPLGGGQVSLSLELSKIAGVLPHQFPYPTEYFGDSYEVDPSARVEDTRFRVGVGYTVEF